MAYLDLTLSSGLWYEGRFRASFYGVYRVLRWIRQAISVIFDVGGGQMADPWVGFWRFRAGLEEVEQGSDSGGGEGLGDGDWWGWRSISGHGSDRLGGGEPR